MVSYYSYSLIGVKILVKDWEYSKIQDTETKVRGNLAKIKSQWPRDDNWLVLTMIPEEIMEEYRQGSEPALFVGWGIFSRSTEFYEGAQLPNLEFVRQVLVEVLTPLGLVEEVDKTFGLFLVNGAD